MKSEDLPIFRSLRMISVIHFIWVAVQCRISHLHRMEGGGLGGGAVQDQPPGSRGGGFWSLRMISVIHFIWVAVQCRISHLHGSNDEH